MMKTICGTVTGFNTGAGLVLTLAHTMDIRAHKCAMRKGKSMVRSITRLGLRKLSALGLG